VGEKTMNNDFLSKFYQSPRPEFVQSLYAKLMQDTKAKPVISRHSTAKRIAFGLAVLCSMFALTLAVSPAARAAALTVLDNIIEKITVRGVTVFVSDEPLPIQAEGEGGESYSAVWTPLSPHDISADYPFFAKLPTWVPAGYMLQERAALYYLSIIETPPSSALFQWIDNAGETIQLEVMKGSCLNGEFSDPDGPLHDRRSDCTLTIYIIVGPENKQEVIAVNDQPAMFFHGVLGFADLSDPVRKWNPSRWKSANDVTKGMTVIWESDGRTFVLTAESATITKENLLWLAESIP
jgi:hypothetical protein